MQKTADVFYHKIKKQKNRFSRFFKWLFISGIIGIIVGLLGTAFSYGMRLVTETRETYPIIILGLPLGGLIIVFLYRCLGMQNDAGTNSVISAVRSEEKLHIKTAPLIFISTLITHLFGGSAGREGAALQMGGSVGSGIGNILHLNDTDMHIAVMCGMSACFSALFGTPIAATFFSMEVVSVGIMYYSALVPCVFSSLIAVEIAHFLGVESESMTISLIPELTVINASKTIFISIIAAILSIAFCLLLHNTSKYTKKLFPNPYIRIASISIIIIIIQLLTGTQDYMGAGMDVIERTMHGDVNAEAALLKMLLTALTLGVGFKGGEIVPSFYVGATFGCLAGHMLGISPSMCAAVGMISLFCGVTNSPITSLLLAIELFGMEGIHFILIGIAVSYMLSGYHSLYHSQHIMYSKYDAHYRGQRFENTEKNVRH